MAKAEHLFASESVSLGNGFLFSPFEFQLLPNADHERNSKNITCGRRSSRAGQDHPSSFDAALSALPHLPRPATKKVSG